MMDDWSIDVGFPCFARSEEGPCGVELVEHWAAANGLDAPTAVGLMAMVAGGLGGKRATLEGLAGETPLPRCTTIMLEDDGTAAAALDQLLQVPREIQDQLRERFSRFSPEVLKEVLEGAKSKSGFVSPEEHENLDRHSEAVFGLNGNDGAVDGNDNFESDWMPEPAMRRLDAMFRPSFLVEDPSGERMQAELGLCHGAVGLMYGGKSLRLRKLTGRAAVSVREVMHGTRTPVPKGLTGCMGKVMERAEADVILHADVEDWQDEKFAEELNKALLIQAEVREIPEDLDVRAVKSAGRRWGRTMQQIVASRLRGVPSVASPEGVEFARRMQAYRQECEELEVGASAVRDLPLRIYWVMEALTREGSDAGLIGDVFRYAGQLRSRHLVLEERVMAERLVSRQILLAGSLRDRIAEHQPIGFRDLVRTFNDQKSAKYEPVLRLMLEAGLILEDDERIYRVGPNRDVEKGMRAAVKGVPLRLVA